MRVLDRSGRPAEALDAPHRPAVVAAAPSAPPAVLRQLPGTVRHFVGRAAELLAVLLDQPGPELPGTVLISAPASWRRPAASFAAS
jgi:hypothetical protein